MEYCYPEEINILLKGYGNVSETDGESPARVLEYSNGNDKIYLKFNDKIFKNTTNGVGRVFESREWLAKHLCIPEIIEYAETDGAEYMLTRELKGEKLKEFYHNPKKYIELLAEAIKHLQNIDITDCPLDSGLDVKLKELDYFLNNGLADVDTAHWESTTPFADGRELLKWLENNRPQEEYVFSHGDFTRTNIFKTGKAFGFIDLGRAGKADVWNDIAFCVRDIREFKNTEYWLSMFFDKIDLKPDWEKIEYYIMLDELY